MKVHYDLIPGTQRFTNFVRLHMEHFNSYRGSLARRTTLAEQLDMLT